MSDFGSVGDVAQAIRGADSIGVVGHVGPDGDALGSMIGLALAARNAGKDAVASFAEPFVVPPEMSFLDASVLVPPSEFPTDLNLAVAVDCSVEKRVGDLAGAMAKADRLAVIDHHLADGSWGDVLWIDSNAAATTELIFTVLKELGWEITKPIAEALYTGLVTDTGRFQYSSTTPKTHAIAAELLDRGVEPDAIGQKLFEEAEFGYYEVASRVLARSRFDADTGLVWSYMTNEDLDAGSIKYHDADDLIDLVRMARGSEIACLLKETKQGTWKGSLRSRGRINVAQLAGLFDGGGHHNAAGFTTTDAPEVVIGKITAELG